MKETKMQYTGSRILGPQDGETLGHAGIFHDRLMVTGKISGGGFALVEHLLPPKILVAPLHIHRHEDEYSFVLQGKVGALLGENEVFGKAGDLIFKPRDEWHTFWNAGDEPLRILELISPAGFEEAFREINELLDNMTPEKMEEIAGRFGIQVDFERTEPILQKHGLSFWINT